MRSINLERHTLSGSSFYSKYWKLNVDFRTVFKDWRKTFNFWDNCFWIGCGKFSLIPREYLSWGVNVWTESPKIFDLTNRDFFETNFSQSNGKIWNNCCSASFSSVWDTLICWLSYVFFKYDSDLCFKMLKTKCKLQKCSKKFRKLFLLPR